MLVTVKVRRRKHIDAGVRANCFCCPIALATKEATGLTVQVKNGAVYWENFFRSPLPQFANYFIGQFDHGLPVEPFDFPLEVPDELMQMGERETDLHPASADFGGEG